jgi:CheY-like chemotaxis protein
VGLPVGHVVDLRGFTDRRAPPPQLPSGGGGLIVGPTPPALVRPPDTHVTLPRSASLTRLALEPVALRDRVVACGECGAMLRRLLAHRDVDVGTSADVETSLPMREDDLGHVYVTSWTIGDGNAAALLRALRAHLEPPLPAVVLLGPEERAQTERCLRLGASAVVDKDDLAGLLTELSQLLAVRFGTEPRVPFDSPATVATEALELDAEATDLRPGGIALRGLRTELSGQAARISFVLGQQTLTFWGYPVREWLEEHEGHAAFRFVGVPAEGRRWLAEQVEHIRRFGPFEPEQTILGDWRRQVRGLVTLLRRPSGHLAWSEP